MSFFEKKKSSEQESMIKKESSYMKCRVRLIYGDKGIDVKDYISENVVTTQIDRALKTRINEDGIYDGYDDILIARTETEEVIIRNIDKVRDLAIRKLKECGTLPTALKGTSYDREANSDYDEEDEELTLEEEYDIFIESFKEDEAPFRKRDLNTEGSFRYYIDFPQQKKLKMYKHYKKLGLHKRFFKKSEEYKERESRRVLEMRALKEEKDRLKRERKRLEKEEIRMSEHFDNLYDIIKGKKSDEAFELDSKGTLRKKKKSRKKHFKKLDARAEDMSQAEYHCEVFKTINFVDARIDFDIMEMEESNNKELSESEVQSYIRLREWFFRFGVGHQIRIPELKGIVREYNGGNRSRDHESDWLYKEQMEMERAQTRYVLENTENVHEAIQLSEIIQHLVNTKPELFRDKLVGDYTVDVEITKLQVVKCLIEYIERPLRRLEDDFLDDIWLNTGSIEDIRRKFNNIGRDEIDSCFKHGNNYGSKIACETIINNIQKANVLVYIDTYDIPLSEMAKTVLDYFC